MDLGYGDASEIVVHTFGWLPVTPDYIVFIVFGCVRCLFRVKILCWLWKEQSTSTGARGAENGMELSK